ncbi:TMV resistance protein N-like [Pistacia vera]|uniref:TMV resistance protein N-like n=1 Tax=Pistacia vera TaxID=55513 RepID=UPI001263ADAB|nr:TMV resistance protein N-like [Pistacia vera]
MAPKISSRMERIRFHGTVIQEIPFIESPSRLLVLDLKNCYRLVSLPSTIFKLMSLTVLYLSGCSKLTKLPDSLGSLEGLMEIKANDIAIKEVPSSVVKLIKLHSLSLRRCKGQEPVGLRLPAILSGLGSLSIFDVSDCEIIKLPNNLGILSSLYPLNLSGNNFESIPTTTSIKKLSKLEFLDVSFREKLKSLPELLQVPHVRAQNSKSLKALSDLSFISSVPLYLEST